jgi:TetR/AcrR family transcriptional regulator
VSADLRSLDTRNKILEVAEGEFAREGYAGAHLQRIAEQVGVQKTALYYYFPSKAALYTAVLVRMLEAFDSTVRTATEGPGTPSERLERLLTRVNDLLAERRNYSQILIRVFVDRGQQLMNEIIQPPIESVVGRILRFHQEGVEAGAFRRTSSRHFFQTLLGATVFYYAARNFNAGLLGLEDIFTSSAVNWRREELQKVLGQGVLLSAEERGCDPERT